MPEQTTSFVIRNKKTKPSALIFPAVLLFLLFYFSWHLLHGNRGLFALGELQIQLEQAHHRLASLNTERIQQEHRVSLLRLDNLDLDMLEEQTRRSLGYTQENEKIIFLNTIPTASEKSATAYYKSFNNN